MDAIEGSQENGVRLLGILVFGLVGCDLGVDTGLSSVDVLKLARLRRSLELSLDLDRDVGLVEVQDARD
jgi:hypothetical protein